jgi:group I intron endonuclease
LLNKFNALDDNIGKSGIYRWIQKTDNNSYVGSSKDLYIRFKDYYDESYLDRRMLTSNSLIYKALLLHGYGAFNLEILEYCDKQCIIEREQYYIDLLKPEYNIQSIAGIVIWPPRCTTTVVNKKDNSVKIYDTMRVFCCSKRHGD